MLMEGITRLLHRADDIQQRRAWLAFPAAVLKKFGDDRAGSLAALIAYYGFISIFPLLLILTTLAAYVLQGNEDLQQRLVDSALAQFPVIGDAIRSNIGSLQGRASALVIGIVGAVWAGLAVVSSVQTAMDEVWDVPRRARPPFIRRVLRGLIALSALGIAVIGATVTAGVATALGSSAVALAVGILLSTALNVATMAVVFRSLTVADVSWNDVLPGALIAGSAWTGLQALGGYLVDRHIKGASDTYGVFAVVVGLLWWLYLGAQLTVFAAEVNVVRRNHLWPRSLLAPPTRSEDERALTRQVKQEEVLPSERVSVEFDLDQTRVERRRPG